MMLNQFVYSSLNEIRKAPGIDAAIKRLAKQALRALLSINMDCLLPLKGGKKSMLLDFD